MMLYLNRKILRLMMLIVFFLIFASLYYFYLKMTRESDLKFATINSFVVCGSLERYHANYQKYPSSEQGNFLDTLIHNDQQDYLSATKDFVSDANREITYKNFNNNGYEVGIIDHDSSGQTLEIICKSESITSSADGQAPCKCIASTK